ncbi:MAG TPA: FkbM family methyltransferase, partial [Acidimicrobiales bacterium]|nr:FkbM family methyltransferase [Acidimicrobiales bacterium]
MTATRVISRSAHWVRAIARHPANRGARLAAVRRAARWHLRTRGGGTTEATVVVDGRTTLMAHPGQFSAVWTLYDGVHEWEEVGFCLDYLRPGDHFVDVGANVGVFSALVGTRQPGVRITAVEPYPPVVADLERNLALNDLDLTVVTDAVGAAPGQAVFEVLERDVLNRLAPGHGTGDGTGHGTGHDDGDVAHHGAHRIPVAVRTLDELVGDDPPALIKIDVEGAELDVLRGAQALLAEQAPVLLFEHCGHGAAFGVSPADMRRFLAELGYSIYLLDGHLTPWESDDLPDTPNVVATKDVAAVRARLASPGGAMVAAPVRVEVRYGDDDRVDARAWLPRRPVSAPGRRWAAATLTGAMALIGTGAAY